MRHALRRIGIGLGVTLALVLLATGAVFLRHYPWPATPERVTFTSGEIEIVGALVLPEGEGPHPAIVLLSGAEPAKRDGLIYRLFANVFVPRGFAVLSYDKRGCGESGGDVETTELPDLAADARAAVRYLRGRPDIRSGAIGLIGASQSGWFTPEVAGREGAAFIINRSAPTLPWHETVLFEIENDLGADGVEGAAIAEILPLRRRLWEYYRRAAADPELALGPERDALEAVLAKARQADWYEQFSLKLAPYDPQVYAAWAGTIFYDPGPWLERLDVPLLAVYGETDFNVPAERSAAVLRRLTADPGRDFTVVVLPGIGHQLQSWRAAHRIGFLYLDEMAAFAEEAVGRS